MSSRKAGTGNALGRGSQRNVIRDNRGSSSRMHSGNAGTADEEDPSYSRRTACANQLTKQIDELRASVNGAELTAAVRQEQMQLLETCLYGFTGSSTLVSIFKNLKVPRLFKQGMTKAVAGLACTSNLGYLLAWLFEYLCQWVNEDKNATERNQDCELKLWLLRTLRQILADASKDSFNMREIHEVSSYIVNSLIMFLDAMDSAEYIPDILNVLDTLTDICSDAFATRFQDIIDLLVGWHIDASLNEGMRAPMIEAYKRFQPFWKHKLPFAFELLHHFLSDMHGIVKNILSSNAEQKPNLRNSQKWEVCVNLFSCFYAILEAVIPIIRNFDTYEEQRAIGSALEQLCPMTLDFLRDSLRICTDQLWIDRSNKVMMRLTSIRPYAFQRTQSNVYEYYAAQLSNHLELSDVNNFIEILMKLIDAWAQNTENSLIHALLDPDSSPLYRFRREYRENKQLNASILVLLRVLVRLCQNVDTKSNILRKLSDHLAKDLATVRAAYAINPNTAEFRRMTAAVCTSEIIMKSFGDKSASDVTAPSKLDVTSAVLDTVFYSYILLDMAASCRELKKPAVLTVFQVLCGAWYCRCSDTFDAILQILKDFWARATSMPSKEVITAPLRNIAVGILNAIDDERNNDVKETMILLAYQYCQKFDTAEITDLVLVQAQKGIQSPCLTIQQTSMKLLTVLNPFALAEARISLDRTEVVVQRNIMSTPHTGTFRPVHYEIVMRHLGMSEYLITPSTDNQQPSTLSDQNDQLGWAQRLFSQCDTLRNVKTAGMFEDKDECMVSKNPSDLEYLRNLLLLLDRLEVQIYNASEGCATNALAIVPRSSLAFFRTNKKTCQEYFARIRPQAIKGARIVSNDHLLIRNILQMLFERDIATKEKVPPEPAAWFLETNHYVQELDHINGLQSWYKRLIRKICHWKIPFQDQWIYEAPNELSENDEGKPPSTIYTWFQVAALFALGRDEEAIKNLQALHAIVPRDDFGFLTILDAQVTDFYTSLDDYDALRRLQESGLFLFTELVTQDFISSAFAQGSGSEKDNLPNVDARNRTATRSLEGLNQLSRQFTNGLLDVGISETLLSSELIVSLKNNLSANRSSLLDIQLRRMTPETVVAEAKDWFGFIEGGSSPTSYQPETRLWGKIVAVLQKHWADPAGEDTHYYGKVYLAASKIARKQGNISTASNWLKQAAKFKDVTYDVLYQQAKLQLCQLNYGEAIKNLSDVLVEINTLHGFDKLQSQSYIKVARLLKAASNETAAALLAKFESKLIESKPRNMLSPVESAIDGALEKAVEKSTTCGKPWFEYATHQYKQGWRLLEEIIREDSTMTITLWARNKIKSVIENQEVDQPKLEKDLLGLFQKYSTSGRLTRLKEDNYFVNAVQQLLSFLDAEGQTVILETLDTLHGTVMEQFRSCVECYFKYLSLDEHYSRNGCNSRPRKSTSMVITASLRLLRMLVKYGEVLKDSYVKNAECVNIKPWKQIIPQLFARLNHPAEFVQQIIGKLIDRISVDYPREILYDVIVSSTSSKTNHSTKQVLNSIAARMIQKNESLWVSTQALSEELKKITVLWEEKWLNKIASMQFDVMQQFQKLDLEVARLAKLNTTEEHSEKIFLETYESVMKFVIVSIEKLLSATLNEPTSTRHEQWFKHTYGNQILSAFKLLQNPNSMTTYRKGWDLFQQLHRQLTAEIQKTRVLDLAEVSPYLASLTKTSISVPGVLDSNQSVFIDSFGPTVLVLPTKTKPKKIDLFGTNGKKYSYLLKGLEDLHLDERIMQLLNVTNGLLKEDKLIAARQLRSRTYSVIPLSDHCGMIQWVHDATPLLSLYKQWQKQEQIAHMLSTNDKPEEGVPQRLLRRPVEIFMDKVAQALRSEGLRVTANRRHWPKHILKKVFLELQRETPGDLLSKELWYSSSDPSEWLRKSTSFSRSLAVMSMLGYIIGLGDRHLDNIMVDYGTGEIIHIDYNVCFEKGKRLRVPELVPYRLSQNLHNALGITGVDGVFRTAAEETLRILRKHKEVFITLLDAFVCDPLVDWESETRESEEKQAIELQANLGLIASRLGEKKSSYEQQQMVIQSTFDALCNTIMQSTQSDVTRSITEEDDESDEETEDSPKPQDITKNAKDRLHSILEECHRQHAKDCEAMSSTQSNSLLETFSKSYFTTDMIPELTRESIKSDGTDLYADFAKQLRAWCCKRDNIYTQCKEEIIEYSRYHQLTGNKLIEQNCYRKYERLLEPVVRKNFVKEAIEEASGLLTEETYCQPLQKIENRAFNFWQGTQQYISEVQAILSQSQVITGERRSQIEKERVMLNTKDESGCFAMEGLLDSLSTVEAGFRRLAAEEFKVYSEESVDSGLDSLEERCYYGCYMRGYSFGLVGLSSQLGEHVGPLHSYLGNELEVIEKELLEALAPTACNLYRLEYECLSLSFALFQYIEREHQDVIDMFNLLQNTSQQDWISRIKSHKNSAIQKLWDIMEAPFIQLDIMCASVERFASEYNNSIPELQTAIESCYHLKKTLLLGILREVIEQYKLVPSDAWACPSVMAWGTTLNPGVGHRLVTYCSTFTTTILLPSVTSVIVVLRNKLQSLLDVQLADVGSGFQSQAKAYVTLLRNVCLYSAEETILNMANELKKGSERNCSRYLEANSPFHWFNAPYIQERKPYIPCELVVQMSNRVEQLLDLKAGIQTLNDAYVQIASGLHAIPEWMGVKERWQAMENEEMDKCLALMRFYCTAQHIENHRDGFSQAVIFGQEIAENLQMLGIIHASDITDITQNPDAMLHVSSELLDEVKEQLTCLRKFLAEFKSPTDGIVPLLEFVGMVEMDADNELRPAQESAKAALRQISNIESQLQSITNTNTAKENTWTCSQLREVIDSMKKEIYGLFISLRTLEGFGLDSKTQLEETARKNIDDNEPTQEEDADDIEDYPSEASNYRQSDDSSERGAKDDKLGRVTPAVPRPNTHVLRIMQRIRAKLEGKDFGIPKKMTVAEQVAKTIEQATLADNLSLMYEGWTSWV
ncbi:Serine/threonine-protein kinase smg1 [Apophysomyces ossiformis]|uniref:non-specific serine/threonine protein kinase n=1 Tax=Apophysomyces ossiformis TaxID=679940 RepID=A0A8H7EPS8_9FUNG|nr:Serine/threonine-protein kinase smg1 [Apophysomyces ossiformis]